MKPTLSDKVELLFSQNEIIEEIQSYVDNVVKVSPIVPSQLIATSEILMQHSIYTVQQLTPYLAKFNRLEVMLDNKNYIPVYYADASDEEIAQFGDSLKQNCIDPYLLVRANKEVGNSHQEIITILNEQHTTLTHLQYLLQKAQSVDGVRGRVSELVDRGIVERYHFSVRNLNTKESMSITYHYLPIHRQRMLDAITKLLAESPYLEKCYMGEDILDTITHNISKRPMVVVELSEVLHMSESYVLAALREFQSDNLVTLTYQYYLADGKNGKFIVSLPDDTDKLNSLYQELRRWFSKVPNADLEELITAFQGEWLSFSDIIETLEMSPSIGVAYLTHLRKLGKVEQRDTEELVVFNDFKFL